MIVSFPFVICETMNKKGGYQSFKKKKVISKVSITSKTSLFIMIRNIKVTSVLEILVSLRDVTYLHMICENKK